MAAKGGTTAVSSGNTTGRRLSLQLAFLVLFAFSVEAASPLKEAVTFSHQQDVGVGQSVFVVGNHPDLGSWDVTRAVKLRYTEGNFWTGAVAVQAGVQLQYRFIKRETASGSWCNAGNVEYLTENLSLAVAAQPAAPYQGKTIYYLSGWNTTNLFYNSNGSWVTAAMAKVGAGRTPGESLYKVSGIGQAGEPLEFVFTDGSGNYDNPPGGGNYLTPLDVFHVQDGGVFSYQPAAAVSAPQIIQQFVNSTAPNIPGRTVRVYLPRGYQQNTTRRYPVLYLHDGQNVFGAGGPFGSWNADSTATREIGQGRMREAIMVGVDNTAARIPEYMPPTDSRDGIQGRADAYAAFLIHNVRPYVDSNFRTRNDRSNTLTLGSSMGGLVSLYLGREFNVFGKIGVHSPAFWTSPNYVNQVANGTKQPLRVYLDMGTTEGGSYWNDVQRMYDIHQAQAHATNADLAFVAGCGQGHNEPAWASRLPATMRYLLPIQEEPAELALIASPPALELASFDLAMRRAEFAYESLYGFAYSLERTQDFQRWDHVVTRRETSPWAIRTLSDGSVPPGERFFWRMRATPSP